MTLANDTTTALAPKNFLIKDYELKAPYLTTHFGRMWTRFNYFVGIESALVGGKLIFGNGELSSHLQGSERSRSPSMSDLAERTVFN